MATAAPPIQENIGNHVMVTVTVQAGKVDEFLGLLYGALEKTRDTPECLGFVVMRDAANPNKLKWLETWTVPFDWVLKNHMPKQYMQDFLKVADAEFLEGDKQFDVMDRIGSDWVLAREGSTAKF